MPQLAGPRIGWENEHLAAYLLSRIAFIAHPAKHGDDIGSDFLCTIFKRIRKDDSEQLLPLNSFAIQVKSNKNPVNFNNKIDYLDRIELPFFLGVVNRTKNKLDIFSGEHLPMMFAHYGIPRELTIKPTNSKMIVHDRAYEKGDAEGAYVLKMPHVLELSVNDKTKESLFKGLMLNALCYRMHTNIAARKSEEYIFKLNENGDVKIFAGSGSAKTFRRNFYRRLSEVFYNLSWLMSAGEPRSLLKEFKMYEKMYLNLKDESEDIPSIVTDGYKEALSVIGKDSSN